MLVILVLWKMIVTVLWIAKRSKKGSTYHIVNVKKDIYLINIAYAVNKDFFLILMIIFNLKLIFNLKNSEGLLNSECENNSECFKNLICNLEENKCICKNDYFPKNDRTCGKFYNIFEIVNIDSNL